MSFAAEWGCALLREVTQHFAFGRGRVSPRDETDGDLEWRVKWSERDVVEFGGGSFI
jgi:hypothetical protein